MSITSRKPARDDDDEIDELPPLEDGDEIEGTGDDDSALDDQTGDRSDDTEAGDLVSAEEIDEDIGDGEDDDADDLDVGAEEIDEDQGARTPADDEAAGLGEEPLDLVGGVAHTDDAGEEGTEAPDPHEQEDLPPLDGDDDDDTDDEVVVEEASTAPRDAALPPWEDAAWSQVDIDAPRVALSVVRTRGGVLVAGGDALLEMAPGAKQAFARPLSATRGAVVALAPGPADAWVIVHAAGHVALLEKKGMTALAPVSGHPFTTLASTSGESAVTLGLTADGDLARLEGTTWASLGMAPALALGGDGRVLTVLTEADGDTKLMTSADGGRTWVMRLTGAEQDALGTRSVAISGDAVALLGDGVLIARSPSADFDRPEGCDRPLAAVFAGTSASSPLLVLLARDHGLYVARIDAENRAWLVADLSRDEDTPAVASLAWDETRGLLFVACAWGLLALAPPRSGEPR